LLGQVQIQTYGEPKLTAKAGAVDAKSITETVFMDIFRETPDAVPAYREMAKNLYAFYAKGVEEFDPVIWEQSLKEAVGFNPTDQTGGFDTVRGVLSLIPSKRTASDVSETLTEMDINILLQASGTEINGKIVYQDIDPEIFEALSGITKFVKLPNYSGGAPTYQIVKDPGVSENYKLVSFGGNDYAFTYMDSGEYIEAVDGGIFVFDLNKAIELTKSRGTVYITEEQFKALNIETDDRAGIIPAPLLEKILDPSNVALFPKTIGSFAIGAAETITDVFEGLSSGEAAVSELDEREALQATLIEVREQFEPGTEKHETITRFIQQAFDTKAMDLKTLKFLVEGYK
jgi:hypothetical protein